MSDTCTKVRTSAKKMKEMKERDRLLATSTVMKGVMCRSYVIF